MHLLNSSVTAAIFLASSSVTFASLSPPFCSWPHLFISSLTLSAHALSLHAHILSLNSPIFWMASSAPFFLQPANVTSDRTVTIAIERFVMASVLNDRRIRHPQNKVLD